MFKGNLVYLSSINKEDLETILKWRNTPSNREFFREFREISWSNQIKWFERISESGNTTEFYFGIRNISHQELLGVCGINYINWINRNCQLSLYIGKDDLYIDDTGYAEEAAGLIQSYAFNTLNLRKVFSEVFDSDVKKAHLLKKLGYILEGELKEHIFKNGNYHSSYIYSLFKKEKNDIQG